MSEKKSKESRRLKAEKPQMPKPLFEYNTKYFENGDIMVSWGFPANYDLAMTIAHGSAKCIMDFFLQKAQQGKLDQNRTIIRDNIIIPNDNQVQNVVSMTNFLKDVKEN